MPRVAERPAVILTTVNGVLGYRHIIESTNGSGSSRALCGRWGRRLDAEVEGLRDCPNCIRTAALRDAESD